MTPARVWQPRGAALPRLGWRLPRRWRRGLATAVVTLICLLGGWVALPYVALWRLERALPDGPAALAGLVDIDAVRDELRRRLNKDQVSSIRDLSGDFSDWVAQVIRNPSDWDLQRTVTLDWVHGLLLAHLAADRQLRPAVAWAWFDRPTRFRVRIRGGVQPPLQLLWRARGLRWQVVAVSW